MFRTRSTCRRSWISNSHARRGHAVGRRGSTQRGTASGSPALCFMRFMTEEKDVNRERSGCLQIPPPRSRGCPRRLPDPRRGKDWLVRSPGSPGSWLPGSCSVSPACRRRGPGRSPAPAAARCRPHRRRSAAEAE